MNAELEAIKDAMDKSTGDGRDHPNACTLAEAYVEAHPEQYADDIYENSLATRSVEDLVKAVDVFRAAGMEEQQWIIETFLLAKFEPQNIGGTSQVVLRVLGLNGDTPAATPAKKTARK
jgi:hypothetical protein